VAHKAGAPKHHSFDWTLLNKHQLFSIARVG